MKINFTIIILVLAVPFILGITTSQVLAEVHWEKTFGGTNSDVATSIQQTDDGGYIIAGATGSFGEGGDAYLIKTDSGGNELWSKNYGGTNYESAASIQQTDDGGYIIVGTTNSFVPSPSNIYLIKTDADGNQLWSKAYDYGEFNDRGSSVDQTDDGGYIIAGTTGSYGAESFYLLKTDAEGNKLWDKTFGGDSSENGLSGQQTSDGGYIITGNTRSFGAGGSDVYIVKTDPNGEQLWDVTFGGAGQDLGWSVQETSDGGYIIAGSTESFGVSHASFYLIKTDVEGNEIWSNYFTDYGTGRSVQETFDGGYIVAGSIYGALDVRILKTDVNGNLLWTKTFGGGGQDWANSVRQTFDGGYIAAGLTNSLGAGEADVYLIYYRPFISVDINIHPKVLNLKSKGKRIISGIKLPEEYDSHDITRDSLELSIPSCSYCEVIYPTCGFLLWKRYLAFFPRQELIAEIETMSLELPANLDLKITGELDDGTTLEGLDTIRVIKRKKYTKRK